MSNNLPLKTIRRILKKYVKTELSLEACLYAKKFLEDILKRLAEASNLELEKENGYREIQKLPKRKRIDVSMIKKISVDLYKRKPDVKCVEQDKRNKELFYEYAVEVA